MFGYLPDNYLVGVMHDFLTDSKIYTRLANLADKTQHFHTVLGRLLHRMGFDPDFKAYLVPKIERKKRFAIELGLSIEHYFDTGFLQNFPRRPIAKYWIDADTLLDASSIGEAQVRVKRSDVISYREYGYLLDNGGLSEKLTSILERHRYSLREQIFMHISDN